MAMTHASTKWAVPVLAVAGLILMPLTASASNMRTEITTAATHAGFASKAGTLKMVHTHLHHTLNCLVGPKGRAFDSAELNPCSGQGHGAIPDAKSAAERRALKAVVATAESGLKSDDLMASQKIAAETASMLKAIK